MNADRYRQIDEIFAEALEIPGAGREAFLSERCGGDVELKTEVLSLLKAQTEAEGFMENSAMNLMAQELAEETLDAHLWLVGKQFGTYKIEKPIGAGGMGEVYLALDSKLNRKVALKILPAEFLTDEERVKRFEREALAVSALNHPYIVTIHDVGSAEGINYIATEYVEGETVRDLINRGAQLKQTLSVISQVCEALSAAHKAGIIHRDIKPENIMLRPDGYVKVLDFGLAKLVENTEFQQSLSNYTQKGIIIGTPAYMSPEQVSDDRVDHRTDLWSISVCLYEMLTGVNPFKGETRQATFQKILSEEPPLVSELKPNLPAELDRILSKALEKDADVSYQTASELRADLKRVRREIDSSPSLESAGAARRRLGEDAEKTRRNYLVPAFGAFLLALIGAGIWFFVLRQNQTGAIDWSKATNIQLTDQQGTEYFPALSPDGKSFVYASDAGGRLDVFIQRVGGKNPTNLTKDSPADDTQPAFSPNGEQIAFRSEREPKGIYVMGASGENQRRVSDFGHQPSWSPDGKEIVVGTFGLAAPNVRIGHDNGLWIVNVETGAKRELLKEDATFPAWSPHGKRIAYWYYPETLARRDIATIPAGGGEPVVITKDFATSNWNPVWSPDGKFLYFVSDKNGNLNFWRVSIDETTGEALSAPEPIVSPSKFSRHLNFSRDGKRMIYAQTDTQSNIQGVEFDSPNERTVGDWFWITRGDRVILRAELSPDGKQFVMRQARRTQDDIVVVNRDGSDWRDITNDAPFDRFPRWSPDGKQIAFASDRNVGMEIWVCDADGSNMRQVTFEYTPKLGSSFPTWSADGKHLIYTNDSQSWLIDLTKNWQQQSPQRVLPPEIENRFITWDWSPDGKKVVGVFPLEKYVVGFYSLETKRLERLSDETADGEMTPSWLADSRRFVFVRENKIYLADSETKKIKEIFSRQPEQIRTPFVSRDGRLLYYTALSNQSDIWLLDNSQNQ
ncbi:MAG TPA: protein kinase [Pyrinomonadaceae bacterium]|jgi:Tol biopolymer transport system component